MSCDGDFTETAYNLGMGNNCGFPNEWTWTQLETHSIEDLSPAMLPPHLWWLSSYLWATLGYLLIATMAATAAAQQVNIFTLHLWTRQCVTVQNSNNKWTILATTSHEIFYKCVRTSEQWGPATRTIYIHKIYDLNLYQKQSSDDDMIFMTISLCDNLIMTLSYHHIIS